MKTSSQELNRFEICLSGLGGQGILTLGKIMGGALALGHGYYVTQTQSYGPEARGGASRSDLVISSIPISYPKTDKIDLLVALSQEAKMDKEVQLQKKMNDFRVNEQSYKRKIAQEKDALMRDLLKLFFGVVEEYGKKHGYTMIMDRMQTGIVYLGEGNDITNDLVAEVNKAWRAKK